MRRVLTIFLSLVGIVLIGAPLVLWVGSYASLDHDLAHTTRTAGLAPFDPAGSGGETPTLSVVEAGSMTFRVRSAGFDNNRGNVILLHGFPESSAMYAPMMPKLASAGFRVVAFDQRGYSPGARPEQLEAYAIDRLIGDVFAVADAVGFDRFHLVGHDWGAAVGWSLVFQDASRIESWSALSIPHMGAYAEAMTVDEDQQERSAYVGFFRMPWLPEAIFSFNGFAMLRNGVYAEHGEEIVQEYLDLFAEPGALTAALNWYRASGLTGVEGTMEVNTPTAFIWGAEDPVVGQRALETQRQYFAGNLWETELDTGHWLMETKSTAVTEAVLSHIERTTAQP